MRPENCNTDGKRQDFSGTVLPCVTDAQRAPPFTYDKICPWIFDGFCRAGWSGLQDVGRPCYQAFDLAVCLCPVVSVNHRNSRMRATTAYILPKILEVNENRQLANILETVRASFLAIPTPSRQSRILTRPLISSVMFPDVIDVLVAFYPVDYIDR
jgi:hypothetical protein